MRRSAVEALGLIDIPSQPVIAGLCSSLRDSDSQVRFTAGLSIARLGADAEEAVDSLVESLKDEDRYVRANAMEALYRIGTEKSEGSSAKRSKNVPLVRGHYKGEHILTGKAAH